MSRRLVLVTRPDGERDPLVAALRAAGFDVAAVPTVALAPVAAGGPLDRAVTSAAWDWVVVTSRRGAAALIEAAARLTPEHPLAAWDARFAVVGDGAAEPLRGAGVANMVIPADARGMAIARAIAGAAGGRLDDQRILLARASGAASDVPDALRALGAHVDDVTAYLTLTAPAESAAGIAAVLEDPRLALAVVASGSAVHGLVTLADAAGGAAARRLRSLPLVSIGPVTTAAAAARGLTVAAQSARPDVPALVAAIARVLNGPPAGARR